MDLIKSIVSGEVIKKTDILLLSLPKPFSQKNIKKGFKVRCGGTLEMLR